MIKKINFSFIIITFLNFQFSHAQNSVDKIDFNTYIEKVKKSNLQSKLAQSNYDIAKKDVEQSSALFLPNLSMSYTGMMTNSPLMAFGTRLNQKSVTMQDFDPSRLNDPEAIHNFNTKFELQQPLINIDGYYGRLAAKSKEMATKFQAERTHEYIELEAYKSYLMLQLAYRAEEVLLRATKTGDENLKLVENYNKQGMIQKSDLLNAMVRVQEVKDQYQSAKTNVKNASDYVSFFMNEPIGKIFQPIESIDTQIIIVPFNSVLNENRKDIQAMQGATDAYRNMYQMNQYSMVPRINAFGAYEMNDKNLVGFGASNYIVGVQMAWNIFDGNKSISKTKKSKLEYMKAKDEIELYKTQNQLELNKTIRQLEDLSRKVNLTNLSHKQSKEAYSIRKNRFDLGLEKTSDLLQSETLMFQKELEYLQAVFEYNYTKKYLQFLTL